MKYSDWHYNSDRSKCGIMSSDAVVEVMDVRVFGQDRGYAIDIFFGKRFATQEEAQQAAIKYLEILTQSGALKP